MLIIYIVLFIFHSNIEPNDIRKTSDDATETHPLISDEHDRYEFPYLPLYVILTTFIVN